MNKKLLWLDDYRNPLKDDWLNFSPIGKDCEVVWVKSYAAFIHWIMVHGLPDAICFDHDLGFVEDLVNNIEESNPEKTGYDAAHWLVKYCIVHNKDIPLYSVQSANTVGKKNIEMLLENYKQFKKENNDGKEI